MTFLIFCCNLLLVPLMDAHVSQIYINGVNGDGFNGSIYLSNNTIFDENGAGYTINSKASISLDNNATLDDILYDETTLGFEWKRSEQMKIVGNMSRFNFLSYFSQKDNSARNENNYINNVYKNNNNDNNNNNFSQILYSQCSYPIPSDFNFDIRGEWIDSGLTDSYSKKIQGYDCKNSKDDFWDDPYESMCDSPTGYLKTQSDTFVKIFECNSYNLDFKYYYTPQQLELYSKLASHIKIQVTQHGINGDTIYTVISNDNSYAVSNIMRNRALSHPYNYNYSNSDYSWFNWNVTQDWYGDEVLLNAMAIDINHPQSFDPNNSTYYSFSSTGVYINDFNTFNIQRNDVCSAFNDSVDSGGNNVTISIYFDAGLSLVSTGFVSDPLLISNQFSGDSFSLYAWGQLTPLNVSVTPEAQQFILSDLTIGELYVISFDYQLNCPSPSTTFTFGLYEVVEDSRNSGLNSTTIINRINTTNTTNSTVTFTNTNTEEKWILDGSITGDESDAVTFTFMAQSSQHTFVLKVGDNIIDTGCFEDVSWDFIKDTCMASVLSGDIYCDEYDLTESDSTCLPWTLIEEDATYDIAAASQYCQDNFATYLWCPSEGDGIDPDSAEILFVQYANQLDVQDYFALGIEREAGVWVCDDRSKTIDFYLGTKSGHWSDAADCTDWWFESSTSYGVTDVVCSTPFYAFLCEKDLSTTVDPNKISNIDVSSIASIQQCIQDEISPFVKVENLTAQSVFSLTVGEQEELGNETCFESLTAILTVNADFENEFGCEIEYDSEISQEIPMYEIDYQVYFRQLQFNDDIDNDTVDSREDYYYDDWELMLGDTLMVYAESMDDIVSKMDELIGIEHKIIGVSNDDLSESMIIRHVLNEDDTQVESSKMDVFQYSNEKNRPFYYTTTSDWKDNSCDKSAINGLTRQKFDNMLGDIGIDVTIEDATNGFYSAPLSTFMPYIVFEPKDWTLLNGNTNSSTTSNNDDQLFVVINDETSTAEDSWIFEIELPSKVSCDRDYISQIHVNIPIQITNFDPSDEISFVIGITDSSYYTAAMIKCNHSFVCQLYFDPSNKNSTSLSRLNPIDSSEIFINWTSWSDNYNSINDSSHWDSGGSIHTDDYQIDIDFVIRNDLLLENTIELQVFMTLTEINTNIKHVVIDARSYDLPGVFACYRDMKFFFGHYLHKYGSSPFTYTVAAVSIDKESFVTVTADNILALNESSVSDDDEWNIDQIIDCDEMDCSINVIDDLIEIEYQGNQSEIVLKFEYPIDNGYFSANLPTTIETRIISTNNNNQIWLLTDGNKFILFTVGSQLEYSVFPHPQNSNNKLGILEEYYYDIDSVIEEHLTMVELFDHDGSNDTNEITIITTNNPNTNSVVFSLSYWEREIFTISFDNDTFEGMSSMALYDVGYKSITNASSIYTISSVTYIKKLQQQIEFRTNIDKSDDFLEKMSTIYYNNNNDGDAPLLLPSQFSSSIELFINNSNISEYNVWQVTLSATFDTFCDDFIGVYNDSTNTIIPGFANMKFYEYNETSGYREQLFDVSFLQIDCPGVVELYIEYPTTYDPRYFLSNCSSNSSTNTNTNTNTTTDETETDCFENDLIRETPFMFSWSDMKYDYILRPTYYFTSNDYSAGMTYTSVHTVKKPSYRLFWLLEDQNLNTTLLILIFPFLAFTFGAIMLCCNLDYFTKMRRHCCDLDPNRFVLDASQIRQHALNDVKDHHFTQQSQFNTEQQRKKIHKKTHQREKQDTVLSAACKHVFPTAATVITLIYLIAIIEKLGQFQGWLDKPIFITFSTDNDEAFLLAFFALGLAIAAWVICCFGGCYAKQKYNLMYRQPHQSELEQNMNNALQIDRGVSPSSNISNEPARFSNTPQMQSIDGSGGYESADIEIVELGAQNSNNTDGSNNISNRTNGNINTNGESTTNNDSRSGTAENSNNSNKNSNSGDMRTVGNYINNSDNDNNDNNGNNNNTSDNNSIGSDNGSNDNNNGDSSQSRYRPKYRYNEGFSCKRHGAFILMDCCCNLLFIFVFTVSFWVGFYTYFCHDEIQTLSDLPQAISQLQNDKNEKLKIIFDWQEYETELMKDYYNSKVIKCNDAVAENTNTANELMENTTKYHNNQMYPTLETLTITAFETEKLLQTALSGAALSQFRAEVDDMAEEINDLASEAKNLIGDVSDAVGQLGTTLCVALGATLSLCSPGCAVVVTGACMVAANYTAELIEETLDELNDKIINITDAAETPEADESSLNPPQSAENSEVDTGEVYEGNDDDNEETYVYDSGNTQQTNPGEDIDSIDGFDFTDYKVFLEFSNVWLIVSFIDLLIVYRKLVYLMTRIINFYFGKIKNLNSDFYIGANNEDIIHQWFIKIKMFFGYFGSILNLVFNKIIPLFLVCVCFYVVYHEVVKLFSIDSITALGVYQIFTLPVCTVIFVNNNLYQSIYTKYSYHCIVCITTFQCEHRLLQRSTKRTFC